MPGGLEGAQKSPDVGIQRVPGQQDLGMVAPQTKTRGEVAELQGREIAPIDPALADEAHSIEPVRERSLRPVAATEGARVRSSSIVDIDHQDNLSQIARSIQEAVSFSRGGTTTQPFMMPNIVTTQNPVAQVSMPFHVPRSKVPQIKVPSPKDLLVEIQKTNRAFPQKKDAIKYLFEKIIGRAYSMEQDPQQKLIKVIAALMEHRKEKIEMAEMASAELDIAHIEHVVKTLEELLPVSLDGVPTRYQKAEILRNLEMKLADAQGEESSDIAKAIDIIGNMPGEYVDASHVDGLFVGNLAGIKKSLTEYIQSTDVIYHNEGRAYIANVLRENAGLTAADVMSYAFKVGIEGTRELLAGKLAASLGLSKFLLNKFEVSFEEAKLGEQRNPKGIASRWLEGASDISQNDLSKYMFAERDLAKAEFKGEDTSQILARMETLMPRLVEGYRKPPPSLQRREEIRRSYQAKLKRAGRVARQIYGGTAKGPRTTYPNALEFLSNPPQESPTEAAPAKATEPVTQPEPSKPEIIGQASLEQLALIDQLFCSYDSHINQYKIENGQAFNFDFARFLAPHEAFTRDGNVYITLRSTLMDHPGTTQPMSPEIIDLIKSWDVEQLVESWKQQGIVGDEEFFKKAAEMIASNQESVDRVQEMCYSQVHPRALKRLQERMYSLKAYVAECESSGKQPTLRGAFDKMYPDLASFMKVLRRMAFNPSAAIGFQGGRPRSLATILENAKKGGFASSEEIQEMEQAMARLKRDGASTFEAVTSIDVGSVW